MDIDTEGLLDDHEIEHKVHTPNFDIHVSHTPAATQLYAQPVQPQAHAANPYDLAAAWSTLVQRNAPTNTSTDSSKENDTNDQPHTSVVVTPSTTKRGTANKPLVTVLQQANNSNNNQFATPKPLLVKSNSIPTKANLLRTPTQVTPRRATLNPKLTPVTPRVQSAHKRTTSTVTGSKQATPVQHTHTHTLHQPHKVLRSPVVRMSVDRPLTAMLPSKAQLSSKNDTYATQMLEFDMMSLENEWSSLKQSCAKLTARPFTAMSRYSTVQC